MVWNRWAAALLSLSLWVVDASSASAQATTEAPDVVTTVDGATYRGTLVLVEGDRVVVRLLDGSTRELERARVSYAGPASGAPLYGVAASGALVQHEPDEPIRPRDPSYRDAAPRAAAPDQLDLRPVHRRPHWALAVPMGLLFAHAYAGGLATSLSQRGTIVSTLPIFGAFVEIAVGYYRDAGYSAVIGGAASSSWSA